MKITAALIAVALLSGCAAVRESDLREHHESRIAPHSGPVCLMKAPMPPQVAHEDLGLIESYSRFYGSMDPILDALAEEARSIGANAVVRVNPRHKMGLIAWARPFADGRGIKLANAAEFDCLKFGGELR